MWNFIEVDKYTQIASNAFDSVYIEELETNVALSAIGKYINEYGMLVDTWKNNVQDFTGYSTRYIDSSHQVPTYIGKFEVADYDGAFYPPAIDMFRQNTDACIQSLYDSYSVLDSVNAMRLGDKIDDDLSKYSAEQFEVTAWVVLDGATYVKNMPDGNLRQVIKDFIAQNSVPGYNYEGQAVMWMTSTKDEFAKYVADNVDKSFYERFYYPLGLTKDNY